MRKILIEIRKNSNYDENLSTPLGFKHHHLHFGSSEKYHLSPLELNFELIDL